MEEIVRKHFKKLRRIDKIQEIIANIKAVFSDHVKPSFLFDICGSDRNTLSAFVTETNSHNFGTKSNLICVDDCHLFIANLDAVKKAIENSLENKLIIIDIGKDSPAELRQVSEHPNLEEMLKTTVKKLQFNNKHDDVIDIKLEPNWNGCSLFGILLGFPCVYYYDVDESSDKNCLSYAQLIQIQGFQYDRVVASFTVPKVIYDNRDSNVKQIIENWREIFGENKSRNCCFSIDCDVKTSTEIKLIG
jgi:hypothetical protein